MEAISHHNSIKKGFTRTDVVHLCIIIVMIIIYIILLFQSTKSNIIQIPQNKLDPTSNPESNPVFNHVSDQAHQNVSSLDIIISIWGFILGLFVSSFVTRFIFREFSNNISIIIITFIISIILLICYYIGANYQDKNIDNDWIRYNQVIFPLIGGLFLISEDAINHLFDYFGDNQHKYVTLSDPDINQNALSKIAGSLIEVRDALARNNILSDTSTSYLGGSDSTSIFTSESL